MVRAVFFSLSLSSLLGFTLQSLPKLFKGTEALSLWHSSQKAEPSKSHPASLCPINREASGRFSSAGKPQLTAHSRPPKAGDSKHRLQTRLNCSSLRSAPQCSSPSGSSSLDSIENPLLHSFCLTVGHRPAPAVEHPGILLCKHSTPLSSKPLPTSQLVHPHFPPSTCIAFCFLFPPCGNPQAWKTFNHLLQFAVLGLFTCCNFAL